MAKSQTRTVLVTSASKSAGSAANRAVLDCTGVDGGIVTMRITNGATGPTVQCTGRILIAHKQGSAPSAGAEGTGDDAFKQVFEFSAGTANSASGRAVYRFGREIAYLEVEFDGNTGQAVTIEANATTYVEA